jgi:hypothetical protein
VKVKNREYWRYEMERVRDQGAASTARLCLTALYGEKNGPLRPVRAW